MCGPCPVPLGSCSLGHGFGQGVPLWGGGEDGGRLLLVRVILLQVQPGFLAYFPVDVACRSVVSADITYVAFQYRPVTFFLGVVRPRAVRAWLHIVPLVSRAGPTVLVSQEIVPQRGLSSLGRFALAGRAGRATGLGPGRGCGSGGDPVRVNFAYALLLRRVVPVLLDS